MTDLIGRALEKGLEFSKSALEFTKEAIEFCEHGLKWRYVTLVAATLFNGNGLDITGHGNVSGHPEFRSSCTPTHKEWCMKEEDKEEKELAEDPFDTIHEENLSDFVCYGHLLYMEERRMHSRRKNKVEREEYSYSTPPLGGADPQKSVFFPG